MQPKFFTINRMALVVKPKQPMLDWINGVFPDDPVKLEDFQGHDNQDIFLLPEFEDFEEAQKWLQENVTDFLRAELASWSTEEEKWPTELTWDLFQEFFQYSLESMVVDTVTEEYDEEYEEK
jgi:hypothetical protein